MGGVKEILEQDFKLLSCRITIGKPNAKSPFIIDEPKYIYEVVDININDTYKVLINKAVVRIAKGTLFNSTIVKNVTFDGQNSTRVSKNSNTTDNITFDIEGDGVIVEKTVYQSLAGLNTINIGERIRIELGYNNKLKTMFEGYITNMSSGSVITLGCENMAYHLKMKTAPTVNIPQKEATMKNICYKYGLLKDTGFDLHPEVEKLDIHVGAVSLVDDLTVADLFNHWANNKIYASLKYDNRDNVGMPKLTFVIPFSSANRDYGTNPFDVSYPIYFNYHVATDNITYEMKDPMFIAVQGTGLRSDGRFFKTIVRRNPDYSPANQSAKKYQFVNTVEPKKKSQKKKMTQKELKEKRAKGLITGGERFLRSDLSSYNVIPYVSKKVGITLDELRNECIAWLESYEINGIEGTVTIFGDYGLTSGVHVTLIDDRNSEKNGIYIVDEVTTNFSPKGGYKQTLKIPYRVKKTDKK